MAKQPTDIEKEAGETLVEVLATIIILGVAIAAILGGLGTTVLASTHQREQASANTVLRSYAEALKRQARSGYVNCASTYTIPASAYTRPTGWAAPTNVVATPGGCTQATDPGLQRVTITLVTPHSVTETLELWVRRT